MSEVKTVALTIDGRPVRAVEGTNVLQRRGRGRDRHPPFLFPSRLRGRGQLPHVSRRDRRTAQARARLLDRRPRGPGRAHGDRPRPRGPAGRPRVPAGRAPPGLPDLRQGRRVQAAGLL
ncbi:MAG: hypothetical protein M0C28_04500 [Candidatus Moduliflexus flocculans]|nr:hypothetical protein [Candidatus Moduliflexus flocculans]